MRLCKRADQVAAPTFTLQTAIRQVFVSLPRRRTGHGGVSG